MDDIKKPDDKSKTNEKQTKTNKKIFFAVVSALLIIIFLIGVYIVNIINKPKEKSETSKPTIGIIRIRDAIKAHKDYGETERIKKEYESIMVEIASLSEPVEIKLPETDEELFNDSAKQKLSQVLVDKIAALEEKRRAAVEKYAKDTESAYEKKRAEIDERYLTVIADLRMKLDNSDILHLTDAKINELSEQLSALQHERGEAQEALKREREQEIYDYGEKVIDSMSEEIASIDTEANKMMSEASLKQSEVMERNMKLLSESMGTDRIVKIKEKEDDLARLKEELYAQEDKIFADISSAAAKYAARNNLELVVCDMGINIKALLPEEFQMGDFEKYSRVTLLNPLDITDDIINDLLIDER